MDDVSTPPTDPFALPPTIPQIEVEPTPPPKRRRTGLLVAAGAVVIAAVVAGVVLLGGDKSDASYSLQAAAEGAAAAQNVAFEMELNAAGQQVTMAASIDVEHQLMSMSAEMPMFSDSGELSMIMDIENKVMYMDGSAFPGGALPTKWVSLDLSKLPDVGDSFGSLTGANPLDTARLFENAANVQDKGVEDLNGEKVKHYVVTVDLDEAIAAQPGLLDGLGDVGADLPDTIDYDVWVTEDNQFRRMSFSMEYAGQTADVDMRVTSVGTIEPIVLPAADEVTDITEMLPEG